MNRKRLSMLRFVGFTLAAGALAAVCLFPKESVQLIVWVLDRIHIGVSAILG